MARKLKEVGIIVHSDTSKVWNNSGVPLRDIVALGKHEVRWRPGDLILQSAQIEMYRSRETMRQQDNGSALGFARFLMPVAIAHAVRDSTRKILAAHDTTIGGSLHSHPRRCNMAKRLSNQSDRIDAHKFAW